MCTTWGRLPREGSAYPLQRDVHNTCIRCIQYFSSDHHQKWARTKVIRQTTGVFYQVLGAMELTAEFGYTTCDQAKCGAVAPILLDRGGFVAQWEVSAPGRCQTAFVSPEGWR